MIAMLMSHLKKLYHTAVIPELRFALSLPKRNINECASPTKGMDAALKWLFFLQDSHPSGGIPAGINLLKWSETGSLKEAMADPYPETSGYIIPTFLAFANSNPTARHRARRIADWLLEIHHPDGSFPGLHYGTEEHGPVVFNTGQIVIGLMAAYEAIGKDRYLDGAKRACRWLCSVQDPEGSFTSAAYIPRHPIQARVAWPILLCGLVGGEELFVERGKLFFYWLLKQSSGKDWLKGWEILEKGSALTHHISYTLRGMLEAYILLRSEDVQLAEKILAKFVNLLKPYIKAIREDGRLPGYFTKGFIPASDSDCLTGNAQLAIILYRLHEEGMLSELAPAENADRLVGFLRQTQLWAPQSYCIHGAIAGSYPCRGDYQGMQLLNWGAKFYIDALRMQIARQAVKTTPTP